MIEAWFRPDTDTYIDGIEQIASRRFPELEARLGDSYSDVVHALGLAAFGLPRGFVNMIGEVTDQMDLDVPARKAALAAIGTQAESVHAVFQNIADKRHSEFVGAPVLGRLFLTRLQHRF